jgi:hypothetical protein
MAEEQTGGLNQMNPAAVIAGGGSAPQTQMFQQMMDTANKRQSYLEQQQAAYNADMEKYAQMVQASQQPGANEAQMWGSMAGAAASVAPTWGNIGAMLGRTGQAYGQQQAMEQQLNIKNQADLTKTRQAEVRALESKDQQAHLLKALYGGNKGANPTIKVVDGKLIKYDPLTDTTEVLSGSQDQIKAKLFKTFYDKAVANEMENPEAYAQQQVEKTLGRFGGTTVTGSANNIPGVKSAAPQAQTEYTDPMPEQAQMTDALSASLSPEDQALAARLIQRINANPTAAKNDTRRLEEILMKYQTGAPSQQPAAPVPGMTYVDKPKKEAAIESSKEGAKMYGESFKTDVLAPLHAFQDTGKIMQDFNSLGEMQSALKNGKLKEFMGGETGKWAMSVLPENSDLRKGIANAQESEKLTASMVNKILMAAKGVQTEGDAQRARSQVTSIGVDPDANKYVEAYINETARQLKMREQSGLAHKQATGNWEGYDQAWANNPIMKEAKGSVKKFGSTWVGLTQYIEKFKAKNQGATDSDAIASWNKVK